MSRKSILFALGLAITAATLYLALRGVDVTLLRRNLANADWRVVPLTVALLGGFYTLKALRWERLLRFSSTPPRARALFGPMMVGFAANNLLPFRVGEIVRIVVTSRRTGISAGTVLSTIVVERILDLITLFGLVSIAMLYHPTMRDHHPVMPYIGVLGTLIATALITVVLIAPRIKNLLGRLSESRDSSLIRAVSDQFANLETGTRAVRRPADFVALLANSAIQWLLLAGAILAACYAVDFKISLSIAVFVLFVITLAIAIPSSPGFVGIIEYGFVLALGAFGISQSDALAAAIFYHVVAWVSVTATGAAFLHRYSLHWSELSNAAKT